MKGLIPKGAAELDGRIQKGRHWCNKYVAQRKKLNLSFVFGHHLSVCGLGDRVVAVNGKSLEGATHQQAVEALRDTGQVRG